MQSLIVLQPSNSNKHLASRQQLASSPLPLQLMSRWKSSLAFNVIFSYPLSLAPSACFGSNVDSTLVLTPAQTQRLSLVQDLTSLQHSPKRSPCLQHSLRLYHGSPNQLSTTSLLRSLLRNSNSSLRATLTCPTLIAQQAPNFKSACCFTTALVSNS